MTVSDRSDFKAFEDAIIDGILTDGIGAEESTKRAEAAEALDRLLKQAEQLEEALLYIWRESNDPLATDHADNVLRELGIVTGRYGDGSLKVRGRQEVLPRVDNN